VGNFLWYPRLRGGKLAPAKAGVLGDCRGSVAGPAFQMGTELVVPVPIRDGRAIGRQLFESS
jgi:hypothetical protein